MRKFLIFNMSEIDKIDFNEVVETDRDWLRLSIDQQKSFIKWSGDTQPSCINSLSYKDGPYEYEQFLTILSGPEWTGSNPIPS